MYGNDFSIYALIKKPYVRSPLLSLKIKTLGQLLMALEFGDLYQYQQFKPKTIIYVLASIKIKCGYYPALSKSHKKGVIAAAINYSSIFKENNLIIEEFIEHYTK